MPHEMIHSTKKSVKKYEKDDDGCAHSTVVFSDNADFNLHYFDLKVVVEKV